MASTSVCLDAETLLRLRAGKLRVVMTSTRGALTKARQKGRIRSRRSGTFRVISTVRIRDTGVVLHAFQTKTQTTSKRGIELVRARWSQLKKEQ